VLAVATDAKKPTFSRADTHRTAGLTRKAVAHLHKLRCTAFCRLR
jgi:hypothetical protein